MMKLWERANNRIWVLLAALIAVPVFVWEIFRRLRALRDDSYTWPASFIQEEIAVVL